MIKNIIKQKIIEDAKHIHSNYCGFFVYLSDNLKFPVQNESLIRKFNLTHGQKIKNKGLSKQIIKESIDKIFVEAKKKFHGTDEEWEEGKKELWKLLQDLTQNDKETMEIYKPLQI